MYFVTIDKNGDAIERRKPFSDYAEAIKYFSKYYQPKLGRGTLKFTTEVVDGEFVRSYSELVDPTTIDPSDHARYVRSIKMDNAFSYDGSFVFLIESDLGIQDYDKNDDEE
ncbi:MAG: hypothetical protein KDA65_07170 [Planctomycetaceae bacterium]|nr:hypothetical protein [Planctomycetaceae bacterium]